MGKTTYIGIGSNLGNKLDNSLKAIALIEMIPGCRLIAQSGFFSTKPIGVEGQDWYVNSVIALSTLLPAEDLLRALLDIETKMGRKRQVKWDARTIDLDIILFGQDIINNKSLTVPHPFAHLRRFVLIPMVQLASEIIHPVLHKTFRELLEKLKEEGQEVIEINAVNLKPVPDLSSLTN